VKVIAPGHSPEDQDELRAMFRMLRRARGFVLAFAIVNHPSLRDELIASCLESDDAILDVRLDPGTLQGVVVQLDKAVGPARPKALMVSGLETLLELAGQPAPHLEHLNLNRGYCGRRFPWPVVFWIPEYAAREFARKAGDFWSCRSGAYRFRGNQDHLRRTLTEVEPKLDKSLTSRERQWVRQLLREHLQDLLGEHDRSGNDAESAWLRAELLRLMALVAAYESDRDLQKRHLTSVLNIAREIGNRAGEAGSTRTLGDLAWRLARYDEAKDYYRRALRLHRQLGDRHGEADSIRGLGWVALMLAQYPEAETLYMRALKMAQQTSYAVGEADAIRGLGHLARIRGRHGDATNRYLSALEIYQRVSHSHGQVSCIEGLGDVAWMLSRYGDAAERYTEARDLARRAGDVRGEAGCVEGLGHVALMRTHYDVAVGHYL
jgi:tetratricopeptide (TPR) repeat protein